MPVLMTVSYEVSGDVGDFREGAKAVAAKIAAVDDLKWKIWGLEEDGVGLSAYLFATKQAADSFAAGPIIAGLKANPLVARVRLSCASVDLELSRLTHADFLG